MGFYQVLNQETRTLGIPNGSVNLLLIIPVMSLFPFMRLIWLGLCLGYDVYMHSGNPAYILIYMTNQSYKTIVYTESKTSSNSNTNTNGLITVINIYWAKRKHFNISIVQVTHCHMDRSSLH